MQWTQMETSCKGRGSCVHDLLEMEIKLQRVIIWPWTFACFVCVKHFLLIPPHKLVHLNAPSGDFP